ncbi:MAG: YhfC family intramembrane metalloprotease [Calditrichaeota bacterium]|nr:YhfC family intramembrane metalloprotease [Calditrichota bacterium]
MVLLNIFSYLLLSSGISFLVGVILLRLIKKAIDWRYLSYGMSFFFVGIALHGLIALPVVVWKVGFKIFLPVPHIGAAHFSLWEIIYYALAAGIGQEIAKGMPVLLELKRTQGSSPVAPFAHLGINLGLGFSLAEIVFIVLMGWQAGMSDFTFGDAMLGSLERISATLFHVGTATWIVYGIEKKKILPALLACIFLHSLADFAAGFFGDSDFIFAGEVALFVFSFLFLWIVLHFVFGRGKEVSVNSVE